MTRSKFLLTLYLQKKKKKKKNQKLQKTLIKVYNTSNLIGYSNPGERTNGIFLIKKANDEG